MTSDPSQNPAGLPDYDDESGTNYSLEVIAELAGVDTRTVLLYQEKGFLASISHDEERMATFDTEALRQLRRIEHLRNTCVLNDAGLRLVLDLLREVEHLRQERREMWR